MEASIRTLDLDGRAVDLRVRPSNRARRLQIRMTADGPEVVVPRRCGSGEVEAFITKCRPWIVRQLSIRAARSLDVPSHDLRDGGVVLVHGRAVPLSLAAGPRRKILARYDSNGVSIAHPEGRPPADLARPLEALLRVVARRAFETRVNHWADALDVPVARVAIRAQRTRWGSSSRTGTLSFNWRLSMAPIDVLDYVALHEVAHQVHMNHGACWQALMTHHMPGWRDHDRWLNKYGETLTLEGDRA